MSTTTEMLEADAARVIVEALLEELQASGDHRRLYLTNVFGVTPAEVFGAIRGHLHTDAEVIVHARDDVRLQAVPLSAQGAEGALLVPYLVGPSGPKVLTITWPPRLTARATWRT